MSGGMFTFGAGDGGNPDGDDPNRKPPEKAGKDDVDELTKEVRKLRLTAQEVSQLRARIQELEILLAQERDLNAEYTAPTIFNMLQVELN